MQKKYIYYQCDQKSSEEQGSLQFKVGSQQGELHREDISEKL